MYKIAIAHPVIVVNPQLAKRVKYVKHVKDVKVVNVVKLNVVCQFAIVQIVHIVAVIKKGGLNVRFFIGRRFILEDSNDLSEGANYTVFTKIDNTKIQLQLYIRRNNENKLMQELILDLTKFACNRAYDIFACGEKYSDIIDARSLNFEKALALSSYSSICFYIPEEGAENTLFWSRTLIKFENIEPILTADIAMFAESASPIYPQYQKIHDLYLLRQDVGLKLSARESLSYIEPQLDFVTKLLFEIIESDPYLKQKALEAIPQYTNFKSAIEENSVFNIKDETKCYEEIENIKKYVRGIQADYYNKKKQILGDGEE